MAMSEVVDKALAMSVSRFMEAGHRPVLQNFVWGGDIFLKANPGRVIIFLRTNPGDGV